MRERLTSRRPAGFCFLNEREVCETRQCCHCGNHWKVHKGSGKIRGFCTLCMGPTCGKKRCARCLPFEKRLELYEKGKLKVL